MIDKFKKHNKGFTLLETLVAVTILATAIAGPLSIASRSLNNSLTAKDQITAFFLAQDAVEYVRFARDSNTLKGADWLTGSGGSEAGVDLTPCTNANGCYFDSTGNSPTAPSVCAASPCAAISYDTTSSLFTYNTGASISTSLFSRQVYLTAVNSNEEKISVTVSWRDVGNTLHSVNVYEYIFKWQ